jgi:hypothetical protein
MSLTKEQAEEIFRDEIAKYTLRAVRDLSRGLEAATARMRERLAAEQGTIGAQPEPQASDASTTSDDRK